MKNLSDVRPLQWVAILLFFAAGVAGWRAQSPNHSFFDEAYWEHQPTITKRVIPPWKVIREKDARLQLNLIQQGLRSVPGQTDRLNELVRFYAWCNKLNSYTVPDEEFNHEMMYEYSEGMPNINWAIMNTQLEVTIEIRKIVGEGMAIYDLLDQTDRDDVPEYRVMPRAELVAILRYKSLCSLLLVLAGLLLIVVDRGLRFGFTLEKMFGRLMVKFAAYSTTLFFSLISGGMALAQQIAGKKPKEEHRVEQVVRRPGALTMLLWSDAAGKNGHDSQLIWQYTGGKGITVIQQNRQSADGKQLTGNITFGWKRKFGEQFSLTAAAGPAFNYKNGGGYDDRINVFVISRLTFRGFVVSGLSKVILPTNTEKAAVGHRHVQNIRGPTTSASRWVKALSFGLEEWRTTRPGRWNEFMVGPVINIGQAIGKPRSFWNKISVYPNKDFCRQRNSWDMRITFTQTWETSR